MEPARSTEPARTATGEPPPAAVGVVGCGNVSRMYLPILRRMPGVEVVAVADVDGERARETATEYGVERAADPDELVADPGIEVLLNLTPIRVHAKVSRDALAAGKHVYSEKPLAATVAEASELVEQARRTGRALGCAPDTMLGTGFQAAREALAGGAIGAPLFASGFMFRTRLPPSSAYGEGATPFLDMAPYYVSALVNLLGPVRRVTASATTSDVATADPSLPIALSGVLEHAGGLMSDVTLAWGTEHRGEVPDVTVYGSDGVLRVPNPNNFGDPSFTRAHGEADWLELPGSRQPEPWPHNLRGLGVGELVRAVRAGRPPLANGEIACHAVDVITGLVRSAEVGERLELTTSCTPAPAMPAGMASELIG